LKRTAVIDVVGLSESLLSTNTPHLNAFRQRGSLTKIVPAFPAVTCTAQTNYLTGLTPTQHGVVGNGWYDRALAEVQFWKQSNHLVGGRKIWDQLRDENPKFTCAQLFWWFNMYASVDWSITPRPQYPADGRKVFDIYAWPYSVRTEIKKDLGEFPFHGFWGPAAGRDTPQGSADAVSRWIAESAKWIERKFQPTLNLIYLPHLDYNLQRLGPGHPEIAVDCRKIDSIVGDLIRFFDSQSVQVLILSEYGISEVANPIHLNRLFREQGWLVTKQELAGELMDYGASQVFAVSDHQVAHIYLKDTSLESAVLKLLEKQSGIEAIWGAPEKETSGIQHRRAGDLIAVAKERAWFTYYYWLDDSQAPDFARTVDIHRKPGYDPVELFLDPATRFMSAKIAWRLVQKRLGFRMLMDVIPLNATLIKGSHGRRPTEQCEWPILISPHPGLVQDSTIESTRVFQLIREHLRH
jgi:predicted AlkP superfamily pyrophosphatase or phosphodiesterase